MVVDIIKNQFSGKVIKDELAILLNEFTSDPCFNTAYELIKYDSNFINYFELARDGGFTESLYKKGEIEI